MIEWNHIDTVLLDMDGTLLDLSFDNFFWESHLPEQYSQHKNISLKDAKIELTELSESLKGTLEWYCIDYWSEVLQINIEALKQDVKHNIRYRPHSLEFLSFLRQKNKTCILVTNAHPKTLELKVASSGLHQYLDKIISSHEFALAKENEGFWDQFNLREKLDLSRCLFIDDSHSVLLRAKQEGIGHILQILKPDTTKAPNQSGGFLGIHDFDELITR